MSSKSVNKLNLTRQAITDLLAERQKPYSSRMSAAQKSKSEDVGETPTLLGMAASQWWSNQPAKVVVEIAGPIFQDYAQRKPMRLIAGSFIFGSVLVASRRVWLSSLPYLPAAILKGATTLGLIESLKSIAGAAGRK